jgi:hypothetical protein
VIRQEYRCGYDRTSNWTEGDLMNITLIVALAIGAPILLLLILAGRRFLLAPTLAGLFLVLGAASLVVMVLTHVAEGLNLFPGMGWGQRHSAGHYLDLISVYLGIGLLVAASLCPLLRRRESHMR